MLLMHLFYLFYYLLSIVYLYSSFFVIILSLTTSPSFKRLIAMSLYDLKMHSECPPYPYQGREGMDQIQCFNLMMQTIARVQQQGTMLEIDMIVFSQDFICSFVFVLSYYFHF
jgi:hypothetical protein